MYSIDLEDNLIVNDIASLMADHTSIQLDIDETKVKAAATIAQELDIEDVIGTVNLKRCIDPETDEDNKLKKLVIRTWCHHTHARLLRLFPGTFTDSGYVIEDVAAAKSLAKGAANEALGIAEQYMQKVLDFLEAENPNDEDVKPELTKLKVRVFGGVENRASN